MKKIYGQLFEKTGGTSSMRRRFILYVASAVVALLMLLLILLSLFGVLDPADGKMELYIDNQLESQAARIEHDLGKLSAHSLSFAGQMENVIDDCLTENNMTFEELADNVEILTQLQSMSYPTVYTNIRVAPCSGAFYILDTTVNSDSVPSMRNGVYIRFANLYSENTVNTKVTLFRGASDIARANDINLFSTWQNEMKTDVFSNKAVFDENGYVISEAEQLPDTWERARFIYSPIYGNDGDVIGICGFEVSDLYLRLVYSTDDRESTRTIGALFDKTKDGYSAQFISNRSGYIPPTNDTVTKKKHGSFFEYGCGTYEYIGKEKEMIIGENTVILAVMLPKEYYKSIVTKGRLKNIAILFIIALAAFLCCLWLSKKYIAPIRKGIRQIKENRSEYTPSGISEIDDLFAYLAEQDRKNEEVIEQAEMSKTQIRNELEQVNNANIEAKQEIARLAYSRKCEVDPDDYKQFLSGVELLTQTERTVFEHYLSGKKVKEITEIMNIKESTVRFHNRNIYSKLGVNSLKQLLRYAAIMKGSNDGNGEKDV